MSKKFVPEVFSMHTRKYRIQTKLSKYLPRWFTKFFADIYVFSHKRDIDIDTVLLASEFMKKEYEELEIKKKKIEIQHDTLAGAAQLVIKLDAKITALLKKLAENNETTQLSGQDPVLPEHGQVSEQPSK